MKRPPARNSLTLPGAGRSAVAAILIRIVLDSVVCIKSNVACHLVVDEEQVDLLVVQMKLNAFIFSG